MNNVVKAVPNEVIGLAGLLAALGIGWYYTRGGSSKEGSEQDTGGSSGMTLSPGLKLAHSGIKVTSKGVSWLIRLRAEASKTILPLIVCTSGLRTYESQTSTMLTYVSTYGEEKFRSLYKSAADDLLKVQRTQAAWLPVVKAAYESGKLHKTGHLSGDALDIRDKDLNAEQRAELYRAAKKVGVKAIYNDGPATHVDLVTT